MQHDITPNPRDELLRASLRPGEVTPSDAETIRAEGLKRAQQAFEKLESSSLARLRAGQLKEPQPEYPQNGFIDELREPEDTRYKTIERIDLKNEHGEILTLIADENGVRVSVNIPIRDDRPGMVCRIASFPNVGDNLMRIVEAHGRLSCLF